MHPQSEITRRDFLRLAGRGLGALLFPMNWTDLLPNPLEWPLLRLDQVPPAIQVVLALVPRTWIDPEGFLVLVRSDGSPIGRLPLARTSWNLENSRPGNQLYTSVPWGIVLHWFGDRDNYDRSIAGYLRGFNSLHQVDGGLVRTSAHFLVGDARPNFILDPDSTSIGILQTQAPDTDGTPFVASHLQFLDYNAHLDRKQYFVRALYQLGYEEPGVHSILQDWFDGRVIDPNMRTIAIEIAGYDFEKQAHFPAPQKIANVVSVVWAAMRRYHIRAIDLLGHHEVQLNKTDPGKKFMALVRYLIGIKALLEGDETMKSLVFGNFIYADLDPGVAVRRYFQFVHDHLLLVSTPRRVYEWEIDSGFWFLFERLANPVTGVPVASRFALPMEEETANYGKVFTDPQNHEGIDLYRPLNKLKLPWALVQPTSLVAEGVCLFVGPAECRCPGNMAIFRHRQPNGGEVLSVYGHLQEIGEIHVGGKYPREYRVGAINSDYPRKDPFLHFAIGYGGTWKTILRNQPCLPLNVGKTWIKDHYLHPIDFINQSIL